MDINLLTYLLTLLTRISMTFQDLGLIPGLSRICANPACIFINCHTTTNFSFNRTIFPQLLQLRSGPPKPNHWDHWPEGLWPARCPSCHSKLWHYHEHSK